jgi:hypothetical protein
MDSAKQNDAAPNVSIDALGMINTEHDRSEQERINAQKQMQQMCSGEHADATPWAQRNRPS